MFDGFCVETGRSFFEDEVPVLLQIRVQKEMYGVVARMEKPGLIILEAPMGEGKTEAALAAAEILMNRFDLKGIAFFLPSQATNECHVYQNQFLANRSVRY